MSQMMGEQMPPQIAQLLAGAHAPQGPPQDKQNPGDLLGQSISAARQAVPLLDPVDAAQVSKFISGLRQIIANWQKEHDQAMGGQPALQRVLRRSG